MCYLQYANKEGKTKSHVQVCKAKCWDVLDICERKRVRLGLQSQMSGCLGLLQKNKYRVGTSDATILSALIYHYYHHHCYCCCCFDFELLISIEWYWELKLWWQATEHSLVRKWFNCESFTFVPPVTLRQIIGNVFPKKSTNNLMENFMFW